MGILYSIATPIGNLSDITMRALETLRTVDVILCEDTRVTRKLLQHYNIKTPTRSYHQHSSDHISSTIIEDLQADKSMALVSDAGTPTISDPGSNLVAQVTAAGIRVVPIPGPVAFIAALQAAGVDTSQFVYVGFIPHKKGRQTLFAMMMDETRTVVAYESPHRLLKTLEALRTSERKIVVGRELTKVHEEFVRGSAEEVYQVFAQREHIKGECVLIVHG